MVELLSKYSMAELVSIIVALGLALKGVIDFFDWGKDKLKKTFLKENEQEENKRTIEETIDEIISVQTELNTKIDVINELINTLIESDKDDIKSFITKEHHFFCYERHWIDDYSLDCLERRFKHYKDEGGNSYIASLMEDLRALPKTPQS